MNPQMIPRQSIHHASSEPPPILPSPLFPQPESSESHLTRPQGTNVYWLMAEASYGDEGRKSVRLVLDDAAALGVSVIRTWAFADGPKPPHMQPAAGIFDPDLFDALDYVVEEARKRGLRLLLPLLNYWEDYVRCRPHALLRSYIRSCYTVV